MYIYTPLFISESYMPFKILCFGVVRVDCTSSGTVLTLDSMLFRAPVQPFLMIMAHDDSAYDTSTIHEVLPVSHLLSKCIDIYSQRNAMIKTHMVLLLIYNNILMVLSWVLKHRHAMKNGALASGLISTGGVITFGSQRMWPEDLHIVTE